jgi:hypothetical protein
MYSNPRSLSLMLCERMDVNQAEKRVSLVGVFHSLHYDRFPSPLMDFTVYAALFGWTATP